MEEHLSERKRCFDSLGAVGGGVEGVEGYFMQEEVAHLTRSSKKLSSELIIIRSEMNKVWKDFEIDY